MSSTRAWTTCDLHRLPSQCQIVLTHCGGRPAVTVHDPPPPSQTLCGPSTTALPPASGGIGTGRHVTPLKRRALAPNSLIRFPNTHTLSFEEAVISVALKKPDAPGTDTTRQRAPSQCMKTVDVPLRVLP